MSETNYKATTEQWKLLQRQGQTLGSAESIALLELRSRVEKLETAQQSRTFTAEEVTPIVAPTNRLHSYKIGEAEPIEHWGKDHTLVNPEPVAPTDEELLANAFAIVQKRLEQLAGDQQLMIYRWPEAGEWDIHHTNPTSSVQLGEVSGVYGATGSTLDEVVRKLAALLSANNTSEENLGG